MNLPDFEWKEGAAKVLGVATPKLTGVGPGEVGGTTDYDVLHDPSGL
jgi:hypothetical protein